MQEKIMDCDIAGHYAGAGQTGTRDPREQFEAVAFAANIRTIAQLTPGMKWPDCNM